MGPATVILVVYAVMLTLIGSTTYNRVRKSHTDLEEAVFISLLSSLASAVILLVLYACSITIYTNSWTFGLVQ